jgi:hypothetical protein
MSKRDDYLDNAAQTLGLADRASALGDKSHLIDLAQKWLDLADRTRHQSQSTFSDRLTKEHLLVN